VTYAKHKTTQGEIVAAWWSKVEQKTSQSLEEHYPGISGVKLFDGMTYADKLRAIPNNALRRAGLKPRRRNGKRKKEQTVLSQASMQKIIRSMNAMATSIAALEIHKRTEQLADFHDLLMASNEVTMLEVRGGLGNRVQYTLTGEEAERYRREQREQSAAMFKQAPFIIGCDLAQGHDFTGGIE
jgi:hypothetical protein